MAIYEYIPEKETLYSSFRKISCMKITSVDAMVGHLCDLADQLRDTVLALENLRTRELARVLAKSGSTLSSISPKLLNELRREWEASPSTEDREALAQAVSELEAEQNHAREQFSACYFPAVKKIRDKCYAVSQSHMADYVMETLADKRKTLDRLAKLSSEALLPLMKNLEDQIAEIDKSISEKLDANVFDEALKLLPSNETFADLAALVEKHSRKPDPEGADKPKAPAETENLPDKGKAAEKTAENTKEPENLALETVRTVAKKAAGSAGTASLASAIPEAAALKLAYQALRSTLSYISETEHVCSQISKRAKLREALDALTKKYDEVQEEYQAVSFDIADLDRLFQFLEQVGDYFTETEKLDITLTAYAEALRNADNNPEAYDGIFLMLRQYMSKLDLIWH